MMRALLHDDPGIATPLWAVVAFGPAVLDTAVMGPQHVPSRLCPRFPPHRGAVLAYTTSKLNLGGV